MLLQRAQQQAADKGECQPHQRKPRQLPAAQRIASAAKGIAAIEPETQRCTGQSSGDIGLRHWQQAMAQGHRQTAIEQPLQRANNDIGNKLAGKIHA